VEQILRKDPDGTLRDGTNGEPAFQRFDAKGEIVQYAYYTNGRHQDGILGHPSATLIFEEKGKRIKRTERFRDGLLNDGAKGEPASERYEDGELAFSTRYKNGMRHNGANGEPACRGIYKNGVTSFITYCEEEILKNGPNGEPSAQFFYDNGNLSRIEYYENGALSDGPNGVPASQKFDEQGNLISAENYKNGVFKYQYTDRDIELRGEELVQAASAIAEKSQNLFVSKEIKEPSFTQQVEKPRVKKPGIKFRPQ